MKISKDKFNFFEIDKINNKIYTYVQIFITIAILTNITITLNQDNKRINYLESFNEKNAKYEKIQNANIPIYKIKSIYLNDIYDSLYEVYLTSIIAKESYFLITGKSYDIEFIKLYSNNIQNEKFKSVELDNIKKIGEEYLFEIKCYIN